MIPAGEALQRLKEGNRRYAMDVQNVNGNVSHERRAATAAEQSPFAIILGCADSRVPTEYIFDQGIGDLFVVRIAGNIAASSQIASVEFAVAEFATKLIVVLGHTNCGAVTATLDAIESGQGCGSPHLDDVVSRIRPAVLKVLEDCNGLDRDGIVARAVRANICESISELQKESSAIADAVRDDGVVIVGAEYSLQSGKIDFID